MSKSTIILNEADDIERRLDWILFKQEQEKILYQIEEGPIVEVWRPGDPLIKEDRWTPGYFMDGFDLPPRCPECETFWLGSAPCFICGQRRLALVKPKAFQHVSYTRVQRELIAAIYPELEIDLTDWAMDPDEGETIWPDLEWSEECDASL